MRFTLILSCKCTHAKSCSSRATPKPPPKQPSKCAYKYSHSQTCQDTNGSTYPCYREFVKLYLTSLTERKLEKNGQELNGIRNVDE